MVPFAGRRRRSKWTRRHRHRHCRWILGRSPTDCQGIARHHRPSHGRRTGLLWRRCCALNVYAGVAVSSSSRRATSVSRTSSTLDGRRQCRRSCHWQPSPELCRNQLQGVHHDAVTYWHACRLVAAEHDFSASVGSCQSRTVSWRFLFVLRMFAWTLESL